jgi:hypothetical protein
MIRIFLLLVLLITYAVDASPRIEDGVHVLDQNNFEPLVKKYDYLLVEFYAPWW